VVQNEPLRRKTTIADFVENTNVKSAVRKLATPISDVAVFEAIVQSVILNNPFGCVSYMSSGASHPPVEKTRESYSAKFVYEDANGKRVGSGSENYNTIEGYTAGISAVIANAVNRAAHGGTPYHNSAADNFTTTLKCHDPSGELYYVNFSRQQMTISSYEDDSIRTRVETWADGMPVLD
jgi:predicted secreted protein